MKTAIPILVAIACLVSTACSTLSWAPTSNLSIARNAEAWHGKKFKPGKTQQCAYWVGHVVEESGFEPPAGHGKCSNWVGWGKGVPVHTIQKGDIVIFKNTYKRGISHIGIAVGDGKFIHRSTYKSPVKVSDLNSRQIAAVRRA